MARRPVFDRLVLVGVADERLEQAPNAPYPVKAANNAGNRSGSFPTWSRME